MTDETPTLPSITVCMTAYNEEAIIANTLHDCLSTLERIPGDHNILVVDDGSTDRTGEILRGFEARYSNVRVLVHPENRGFVAGLRWLIAEAEGDLIFHLAADGEWKAAELHGMLAKLSEGYDIVIGVRREKHYSFYRGVISRLYNLLVLVLFGKQFRDIGSIRLARASLWKRIPATSNSAFFIAEKLLLAHRNGARIGFVPVDHQWRSSGHSKFNNPLNAARALGELVTFWMSPRSRQRIEL
jgi:dolichol-phosphate mannosyltransferase